jgi:hypothetical protein
MIDRGSEASVTTIAICVASKEKKQQRIQGMIRMWISDKTNILDKESMAKERQNGSPFPGFR